MKEFDLRTLIETSEFISDKMLKNKPSIVFHDPLMEVGLVNLRLFHEVADRYIDYLHSHDFELSGGKEVMTIRYPYQIRTLCLCLVTILKYGKVSERVEKSVHGVAKVLADMKMISGYSIDIEENKIIFF